MRPVSRRDSVTRYTFHLLLCACAHCVHTSLSYPHVALDTSASRISRLVHMCDRPPLHVRRDTYTCVMCVSFRASHCRISEHLQLLLSHPYLHFKAENPLRIMPALFRDFQDGCPMGFGQNGCLMSLAKTHQRWTLYSASRPTTDGFKTRTFSKTDARISKLPKGHEPCPSGKKCLGFAVRLEKVEHIRK